MGTHASQRAKTPHPLRVTIPIGTSLYVPDYSISPVNDTKALMTLTIYRRKRQGRWMDHALVDGLTVTVNHIVRRAYVRWRDCVKTP